MLLCSISVIYFIFNMDNSKENYISKKMSNDITDNIIVNESIENSIQVQKENENIEMVKKEAQKTTTSENVTKEKQENQVNENKKIESEIEEKQENQIVNNKNTENKAEKKQENQIVNNKNTENNTEEKKQETTKKVENNKQTAENNKKDIKQKEKSIYDYEFNIKEIKSELISIGESIGLKHRTTDEGTEITPNNSSWASPVTGSKDYQGKQLEASLKDYVRSMPEMVSSYGGTEIEFFTIYVEDNGNGSYTFYFLY